LKCLIVITTHGQDDGIVKFRHFTNFPQAFNILDNTGFKTVGWKVLPDPVCQVIIGDDNGVTWPMILLN